MTECMHYMVDLETFGTTPGSVIVAIGAVCFDDQGLYTQHYTKPDIQQQLDAGMTVNSSTLLWWLDQEEEARLEIASNVDRMDVKKSLNYFHQYIEITRQQRPAMIWGNGATFDNVLLMSLFNHFDVPAPWPFRNNRCYRTIKEQHPEITGDNLGEANASHIAVEDAIWQAQHLLQIHSKTDFTLE